MILVNNILRGAALLLVCTALSACFGNNNSAAGNSPSGGTSGGTSGGSSGGNSGGTSGGGTAGQTASAIQQQIDRIGGLGPTRDMPLSGSASYKGAASATLHRGKAAVGEMLGDIEMSVKFAEAADPSRQTDAVNGKMNNFRGTIDGQSVTFDGELSTAEADKRGLPSTIMTNNSNMNVPGVGNISSRTGAVMVNFAGDLEVGDKSGPVSVMLGGAFMGSGAQGATGAVSGTWWDPGNPEQYTVGGKYYVERQ